MTHYRRRGIQDAWTLLLLVVGLALVAVVVGLRWDAGWLSVGMTVVLLSGGGAVALAVAHQRVEVHPDRVALITWWRSEDIRWSDVQRVVAVVHRPGRGDVNVDWDAWVSGALPSVDGEVVGAGVQSRRGRLHLVPTEGSETVAAIGRGWAHYLAGTRRRFL